MRQRLAVVLLGLALLGPMALADEPGFYVGGGALWANLRNTTAGTTFDGDGVGYKAFVGYRFARRFAVEAAYNDFGSFSDTVRASTLRADVKTYAVWGLAVFPIGSVFEVIVKLAVAWTAADLKLNDASAILDETQNDLELGWGLAVGVAAGRRVTFRGEFESYETDTFQTVQAVSVGIQFNF